MKVLAVGGGSGGHVTPVRAVIAELARRTDTLEVRFVCDRGYAAQARELLAGLPLVVPVTTISTGKLRRYHGVSLGYQLLDIPTQARNVRDVFEVLLGGLQSLWLLLRWRPDVVFTKGGFVCLPVGWAAHLLRIPLVIHDSDIHPGLTNRVLARWAAAIATGGPLEYYPYDPARTRQVGIPVDASLRPVNAARQQRLKSQLGMVDTSRPLIVVTGGGLGARRLNAAVAAAADGLIAAGYSIYHLYGLRNRADIVALEGSSVHYQAALFSGDMPSVLGAADIVVTRAGATILQEVAALAKPTIIIPNGLLTGGHQLKNAQAYADSKAAVVLDEVALGRDPGLLTATVTERMATPADRARFAEAIARLARPDAALDMAAMIADVSLATSRSRRLGKTGRRSH